MEDRQLRKEKDIKTKLYWALGLATLALLLMFFRLPFDFLLSLVAYIITAIAVVKKDGAMGILQVIMVFPAIYIGIRDFFDGGNDEVGDVDSSKPAKLERLANFTLFFTAVTILVTILFPIVRFFWNLFT
jgi:hypothetical protein